jgi:hypothetical protein
VNATQPAATVISYALQQLFVDQERDWVIDTIAPVLAWVPGTSKKKQQQPFRFRIQDTRGGTASSVVLDLGWDASQLEQLVPGVVAHAARLRAKRSAQREHVTELAGYGLAFVAISVLMPGRRVVHVIAGSAPDLLFDVTPAALRGVEVSGRKSGGAAALAVVRDGTAATGGRPAKTGKASQLSARNDIAEVYLSLWCASPRISIMEQLVP